MDKTKAIVAIGWYVRHRTKIWSTIWCVVGVVSSNIDRIMEFFGK
jgi:hypothetical protein